jgi:hypothetical protein
LGIQKNGNHDCTEIFIANPEPQHTERIPFHMPKGKSQKSTTTGQTVR